MPEEIKDLDFWSRGDVITADRLNEMVCRINNVSLLTLDNGTVGKADSTGFTPERGHFKRVTQKMHPEDGISKIIDSFIIQGTCDGNYARKNGVNSWTKPHYDDMCGKEILPNDMRWIGEIEEGAELYQQIKFDKVGNVLCRNIVQFPANCRPTNSLWKYTQICASEAQCGVLYNRLTRISADCRLGEDVPQKSQKYTTISTNDFFISPVPMNAYDSCYTLLKPIEGNTIPVRGITSAAGTNISNCDTHLEIRSGVTFGAGQMPQFNIMKSPACVKWTENFGFKITPNQQDNPYLFNIETFGSPSSANYQAGCAIDGGDLQAGIISVKAAHSASSQKGYVFKISTDSSISEPTIQNGHIKIPKVNPGGGNEFSCWFCVDCQTNIVTLNEEKLNQAALNLANCITSSITTTSSTTLDYWNDMARGNCGEIQATITTLDGCNATASINSITY